MPVTSLVATRCDAYSAFEDRERRELFGLNATLSLSRAKVESVSLSCESAQNHTQDSGITSVALVGRGLHVNADEFQPDNQARSGDTPLSRETQHPTMQRNTELCRAGQHQAPPIATARG